MGVLGALVGGWLTGDVSGAVIGAVAEDAHRSDGRRPPAPAGEPEPEPEPEPKPKTMRKLRPGDRDARPSF